MGFKLRQSFKLGPLRFNFTKKGFSSVSFQLGRFSWNSRTRRKTIDTPGPGSYDWK